MGNTQECPTCGTPCTVTSSGLELVENSGDESLATKHYHPLPSFEEIEYERLKAANEELCRVLETIIAYTLLSERSFLKTEVIGILEKAKLK